MKETWEISVSKPSPLLGGFSDDEFQIFRSSLTDLIPSGVMRFAPGCLTTGDARIPRILRAIENVGIPLGDGLGAMSRKFRLFRNREYEHADLSNCEYAILSHHKYLGEVNHNEYDERGIPCLKAALRPYDRKIGRVAYVQGCPVLVVRGAAKDALEKSRLKGLRITEPIIKGRKQLNPEQKVWVVWSELTLPPMKNLCFDDAGERFRYQERETFRRGCYVFEGHFSRGEIHYQRGALAKLGEFDIALTTERFGGIGALQPFVVMSQRFRHFMEDELGLEMIGAPVRVDDDDTIPWGGPYPEPWEHLNKRPEWLNKLAE